MLFGPCAQRSAGLPGPRSRTRPVVCNHPCFRPARIRLWTSWSAASDASGCGVRECSRERRHAGGAAPVPKPSTAGSYPVHREKTADGAHHGGYSGGHSRGHSMMVRFMRMVGRVVVGNPGLVTALSLVVTLLLYANIHKLRTGTDLTDLFGNRDPQWRTASQIGKDLGYGNQLFVVIEAPAGGTDVSGQMEDMAGRLTADMQASGLFVNARSGLQDEELLNVVRFFTWNFPSFARPAQAADLKQRQHTEPH